MSPTFITFTQVLHVGLQSDSIFTETFDSMSALGPDYVNLLRPGADTAVVQNPIGALSTQCNANAQDRLVWKDKTCPALIMSWKALLLLLLLIMSCRTSPRASCHHGQLAS